MKRSFVCSKCKNKFLVTFRGIYSSNGAITWTDNSGRTGVGRVCRKCRAEHRGNYLKKTNNRSSRTYEKTINGFLMRKYRNMKSRIFGIQKQKAHLYVGKSILDKEIFYVWAKQSKEFYDLYNKYKKGGFNRKLCPTVNRINPALGYSVSNMEWITHSENSRLGSLSKRNKSGSVVIN